MDDQSQLFHEAALILPAPEAEILVDTFRERYDPVAKLGVPAHITINYPFNTYTQEKPDVLDELKTLFQNFTRFEFQLIEPRRFPGVLYLAIKPEKPFILLVQAVWKKFPDSPPYGGVYNEIVPHLTVAVIEDNNQFNCVCEEFETYSKGRLPIDVTANQVWLMTLRQGEWGKRAGFEFSKNNR
jgi:2'-5' RNA ligase